MPHDAPAQASASFDASAPVYDDLLEPNRRAAQRLVAAIPDGGYARALDVGCGTGFAAEALIERFGVSEVTGVDPSEPMLERCRARLAAHPGTALTLMPATVDQMQVPDASFDLTVSAMAFHWMPDKPAAVAAMARATRPGGIVAVLAAGRGADGELLEALRGIEEVPQAFIDGFEVQRGVDDLTAYFQDAGLQPIDVWEELRRPVRPVDQYLARMDAVAGHLSSGVDEARLGRVFGRVTEELTRRSGPEGLRFTMVKLFGVARRP